MSQTLLDITADMAALDALLAESGGEITPDTEATLEVLDAQVAFYDA